MTQNKADLCQRGPTGVLPLGPEVSNQLLEGEILVFEGRQHHPRTRFSRDLYA